MKPNKKNWTLAIVVVAVRILAMPMTAAEMVVNGRVANPDATTGLVPGASALTTATNATIRNTTSAWLAVPPNSDIAFWPSVTGNGASDTNAMNLEFETSPDGVTASTTTPMTLSVTPSGTNVVIGYAVVSRTNWFGAQYIRWTQTGTTCAGGVKNISIRYRYYTP